MSIKTRRKASSALLVLTFLALIQVITSQGNLNTTNKHTAKEVIGEFKNENIAAVKDVIQGFKDMNKNNSAVIRESAQMVEQKLRGFDEVIKEYIPSLHEYFKILLEFIKDYKEIAIGIGTVLMTAYQMIFGGGVQYLTSKMKNLSEHKIMIEQGFDLQFRLLQKKEMKQKKSLEVSDAFNKLFEFLNVKDNKEIKLILGTTGVGFSSNIQQWMRVVGQKQPQTKCIFYDMTEPAIRTNSALASTHMACISAIVYSLLHQADRNFVLSIVKSINEKIFEFCSKIWHYLKEQRPIYIIMVIIFFTQWLRQIQILILLTFITQHLLLPIIKVFSYIVADSFLRMYGIVMNVEQKPIQNNRKIKIIVDNFQVLSTQFEQRQKQGKLTNLSLIDSPFFAQKDNSTYEEHKLRFVHDLTTLFNNISSLQDSDKLNVRAQIIIIVRKSTFYKQYIQQLKLNTASPFKTYKLTQLKSKDIQHTIEQRVQFQVQKLTTPLKLFHNSSKQIMKLLRQCNIDKKYISKKQLWKQLNPTPQELQCKKIQTKANFMRSSMKQILVHAQRLERLSSFWSFKKQDLTQKINQNNSKKKQESQTNTNKDDEEYKRYIGLFMGCIHKQLLFFCQNKNIDDDVDLSKQYQELMDAMNQKSGQQIDMISTISPGNKHYLFNKINGYFAFKPEIKQLILKWNELIDYIQGDNSWVNTLQTDFLKYYTENLRFNGKLKTSNHEQYHRQLQNGVIQKKYESLEETQLKNGSSKSLKTKKNIGETKLRQYIQQRQILNDDNEYDDIQDLPTFDKQATDAQGRRVFAQIVDFLTDQEIISDHIFFSRSMALANFYLQQKIKEQLIFHRFQNKKCKLAKVIQQLKIYEKQPNKISQKIIFFQSAIRSQMNQFIKHEARSYEEGMDWLKYYNPVIATCNSGQAEIEPASKYFLFRTDNSYVLRNYVRDILLYWSSFRSRINNQKLQQLAVQLVKDAVEKEQIERKKRKNDGSQLKKDKNQKEEDKKIHFMNILRSKTTVLACWFYEKYQQEENLRKNIIGCSWKEIADVINILEKIAQKVQKQKAVFRNNNIKLKEINNNAITSFLKVVLLESSNYKEKFKQIKNDLFDEFLNLSKKQNQNQEKENQNKEKENQNKEIQKKQLKRLQQLLQDVMISIQVKKIVVNNNERKELKLRQLIYDYRQLLKIHNPQGLFKQISIKYRKSLFKFTNNGRCYDFSLGFKALLSAYHHINSLPQQKEPSQNQLNEIATKILRSQKWDQLKQRDWYVIVRYGNKLDLSKSQEGRKESCLLQLKKVLFCNDFKGILAALCYKK